MSEMLETWCPKCGREERVGGHDCQVCEDCGKGLGGVKFHLDSNIYVCMECWNGYPQVLKDHGQRMVVCIAKLEVALRKYMAGVISHESVDYIDYLDWNTDVTTTPEEIAFLKTFVPDARKLAGYDD